jgi:hypothetical protein
LQQLNQEDIALIESLAVRRDMVTLLSYIREKRPVGTQSTGNLQLKAVREVCARFVNPPVLDEKVGGKIYKLRSEEHIWSLFFLHRIAETGGLVIGGQARVWRLTPAGEVFLELPVPVQFGYMLTVWWHEEDWTIAWPVTGLSEGLPRYFKKEALTRLLELKVGKLASFEQFADELIVYTKFTWPSIDQTYAFDSMRWAIQRMVVDTLADFGCLECEYKTRTRHGFKSKDLVGIRLTQLEAIAGNFVTKTNLAGWVARAIQPLFPSTIQATSQVYP